MRLEAITLHGFKSFAEKTVVKVLPGVTGIVGPNGCGKCLSGDTPVVLADGRIVPIRSLVEDGIAGATVVHQLDDGVVAPATAVAPAVLTLDPVTLRLEHRPIDAFIRRSAPPFLLRVRTRSGREILTTHYHPFFSLEDGRLNVLTAEQLTEGVRIAVPRNLPVKPVAPESTTRLALRRFGVDDRAYVLHSPELREWLGEARHAAGGWDRLAAAVGAPVHFVTCVTSGQPVRAGVIGRVAERLSLTPPPIDQIVSSRGLSVRLPEMDGRLARFLGYLIAEGRVTRASQVWFVNSDPMVNAEFGLLAQELFGVVPRRMDYYKRGTSDTLVFSEALCLLLDRVFGVTIDGASAGKAAPVQVMTAPDDVVAEFLSGLFEGDAFVHEARTNGRAMPYVEYVSASRRLAEDVCTLLLRLGVFPLLRPKRKSATNTTERRAQTYYSVYVYGREQVRRLAGQLRFAGTKQARLDAAAQLQVRGNPNLDLVPGLTSVIRAAARLGGIRVKAARRLCPKLAAYVEGRCAASRQGLHEVADMIERVGVTPDRARPLLRQLRTLADADVCWDEVVSIERTPPPEPWVYDLTIDDTHNFVAANVIVHNSNISEAVRWALGEQSAKSLRGQRMEDLIFHGTGARKPIGLAEVELTFSNDGTLSVPWSEIAVARRLYRTGEGEYLLNKQPTRLRDILDLFAGTGANPRAYSVMDQDKLNHVLTAKPHERRVFIEEAAGIARYKQQRSETQGKLDAARQNLVRVRDVMDEVRRQLGSLERQAKKAQQYKALQAERRELALALVAADFAGLTAQAEALAKELTGLRDAEQGVRARQTALAAREVRQREGLQASEHRLADVRQSVQKIQGELERLLERREQMGVQLHELGEETARLGEEVRVATERLDAIVGERETALAALAEAERLGAERSAAVQALESEVERHRAGLTAERDRLEALRLEQMRVAAERVDLMRQAGELRERQSQLGRRGERLALELAEAQAEVERLTGQRAALESAHDAAVTELTSLVDERERLTQALADREGRLAEAEGRLAQARLDLAARSSSRDAVRELEVAREGYGAGVRAVFAEGGGPTLNGVVGTVADLIEVEPGLEQAVEAVLGERLQWVVVEQFEHARAAVSWLREHGNGAATFLPLEKLQNGHSSESVATDDLTWIVDHVTARAPSLVRYLLGQVAIVEDLDQAEARWRRNGVVATYVTPSGEVLSPTGRLRGGSEGATLPQSLLTRKRQLRDLEDEVRRLTETVDGEQGTVATLAAEVGALRARLGDLEQSVQARQAERLTSEKDLEQSVREHERVHRHVETIGAESRQVAGEAAQTDGLLAQLGQHVEAAAAAESRHESVMAAVRAAIAVAQDGETTLGARLTAARVELAGIAERTDALRRELGRLDEMEADFTMRIDQGRQRHGQLGERRAWLAAERERTDAAARDVAAERDRREDEARQAGESYQALADELRAIEDDARTVQGELNGLVGAIHEIELKATEGRVRREELAQEAYRTYGVEAVTLRDLHDATRDLVGVRERLIELDSRLEALGAVNLVADEEYRELDERLTFLRTQHDDLTASIKDLEKALRGMTRTAQERFAQAFEEINGHFGRIFARLFEGGRAELRLVEAEEGGDPLDTGVELMAQPRGKRLQAASLMSGGERALTGLALLFAIFYFRPSPFCVLDEVDAPLDDANIHRFLRVLRELTSQTQFLVITHNRKTMEAADILYGVTMEEPGLSKLVSVNLAAAVASASGPA